MKHISLRLGTIFSILLAALFISSCSKSDDGASFEASMMTGKWKSGTEYYCFASNGTGYTWNSSEVTEEDAQDFTWSLSGNKLTINHNMSISSATIPKIYTMLELSTTVLKFKDDYKTFSFTKAQ